MALTNIDPSTFVVPEGQSLLYNSGNQYYYKSSTGQTVSLTTATMSLLGVKSSDLPCLVYTSDLSDAVAKSSSSSDVGNNVVASASKASTVYTNLVASQKVAKHTFLNEISQIKDALELRLKAYTTMPAASADYAGEVCIYIGTTTTLYTKGYLYIAEYNTDSGEWQWVTTSSTVDIEFLMTLIAANTAKVEACEDRITALETANTNLDAKLTQVMTHLGLV